MSYKMDFCKKWLYPNFQNTRGEVATQTFKTLVFHTKTDAPDFQNEHAPRDFHENWHYGLIFHETISKKTGKIQTSMT